MQVFLDESIFQVLIYNIYIIHSTVAYLCRLFNCCVVSIMLPNSTLKLNLLHLKLPFLLGEYTSVHCTYNRGQCRALYSQLVLLSRKILLRSNVKDSLHTIASPIFSRASLSVLPVLSISNRLLRLPLKAHISGAGEYEVSLQVISALGIIGREATNIWAYEAPLVLTLMISASDQ